MEFDQLLRNVAEREAIIAGGPIVPSVTQAEIRDHLAAHYDFATPIDIQDITADVERMMQKWNVQITHPRYLGLFNPGVTAASVLGDTLTAIYNPQLAAWRTSPAANEIERHTLGWLAGKLGLPADSAATFTSGGAEANLSAVVVALTKAFPDFVEKGLRSLPGLPVLYLSAEAHHSFHKIVRMTGLGEQALRVVKTDAEFRMDVRDLKDKVAEDRRNGLAPFLVVGTAGTTAAGMIDPLPELAQFCEASRLWFHVDAAWGGAAAISPLLKKHLEGIERADSITCDAHKWFSVPMGAGMFFCRHPEVVNAAFRAETSYMPGRAAASARDPYVSSVQWSRRFTGLKLFLPLAQHGEQGYARMIEHQARMGDVLRQSLTRTGWRIVNTSPLPVVCFTRDGLDTRRFLDAVYERQIAWISETRLAEGSPVLRACITNYRTTEQDIAKIVDEMNRLVEQTTKE